jgi:CheY-like chemotaxis protein
MNRERNPALTALVVDDVLLDRVFVAVALRQLGYRVVQALDGEEALRRLDQETVHLVCVDWNLPGLSGAELAKTILGRREAPPVIAITSDDSPDTRATCLRLGISGILHKGFTNIQLKEILSRVVSAPTGAIGPNFPEMVSEQKATRRLLVGRSQEQFAAERVKFGQAMSEGHKESALRALHNLVSLSGMVGALSIHEAARHLAEQLRLGRPIRDELAALDTCLGVSRTTSANPGNTTS